MNPKKVYATPGDDVEVIKQMGEVLIVLNNTTGEKFPIRNEIYQDSIDDRNREPECAPGRNQVDKMDGAAAAAKTFGLGNKNAVHNRPDNPVQIGLFD